MDTEQTVIEAPAPQPEPEAAPEVAQEQSAQAEPEAKPEPEAPKDEPKREKTHEEKELARQRRRIDNLTRRLHMAESELQRNGGARNDLHSRPIESTNGVEQVDSDELRLSRAEAVRLIEERAKQLAPTIAQQHAEESRRQAVVEKLSQSFGKERFDELAQDLDDALGGLRDGSGRPKPAIEAIFEADQPADLIEYLADPDNSVEAEAIARMNPVQAGRAVARLEQKLRAKKAEAKPERSNAPAPVEPLRGQGAAEKDPSDMSDTEFAAWRRRQIAQRR